MKVLISGDRRWGKWSSELKNYSDSAQVVLVSRVIWSLPESSIVIEGEARGADELSRIYAEERGLEVRKFPADWDKYGKRAGPVRNLQMLDDGRPDILIYFHDDLANSKGTGHMVREAMKARVKVFRYDQWLVANSNVQ